MLFLFFGWGNEEAMHWPWSWRGNISALLEERSFEWHANTHTFFIVFPEQTLSPYSWQRADSPMDNSWPEILGLSYFLKINNPLFRGLPPPHWPVQNAQFIHYKNAPIHLWGENTERWEMCPQSHRRQHKKKGAKPSRHQVAWLSSVWLDGFLSLLKDLKFSHSLQDTVQILLVGSYRPPWFDFHQSSNVLPPTPLPEWINVNNSLLFWSGLLKSAWQTSF